MDSPSFYDPAKVGTLYAPDIDGAMRTGQSAGLKPAGGNERRVVLILVDAQADFIHADGALSVPGAIEDTRRTVEWLVRSVGEMTTIVASLDTHEPLSNRSFAVPYSYHLS